MTGSAADPRRRTEVINSYKNLDDLTKELNNSGFDLRSSSLYLQLILRKKDSTEGKRHTVAKVILCRAQSMQRSKNPDWWFVAAIMKHVEDFALVTGENNVAIPGKDHKAHIPLSIPVATKQSPILMFLEYPVLLPEHTFAFVSDISPSFQYINQERKSRQE